MALTADAFKRLKREGWGRAREDPELLKLLREVAAAKHARIPHEDGEDPDDLLGGWMSERLIEEGKLRMMFDKSVTPGQLRGLANKDIDQYWASVRRRGQVPRLFKRIDELLRTDENTFEVRLMADRAGDVYWTLADRPANAIFSERDHELYAHVSALNLKTLEEGSDAGKRTQFLSAGELRRYVIGMLDNCGRALSLDQLTRGIQVYYHLESTSEELPDENELSDKDRDKYAASVAVSDEHDPPGRDGVAKANRLLQSLSARQRTILMMALKEHQQNEISEAIKVSPATVSKELKVITEAISGECHEKEEQLEMLIAAQEMLESTP